MSNRRRLASCCIGLENSPEVKVFLDKIATARNVYFIGCGTSYHACLNGAVSFAQLAGKAVIPVLAPQFIPQYLPTIVAWGRGLIRQPIR